MVKVQELLTLVETEMLDGQKFPNGRLFCIAQEERRLQFAVTRIVTAYELFGQTEQEQDTAAHERIFYLARAIADPFEHDNLYLIKDFTLVHALREMAKEGREQSLQNPATVKERVAAAKLFQNGVTASLSRLQLYQCL